MNDKELRQNINTSEDWFVPPVNDVGNGWWVKAVRTGGTLAAPEGLSLNTAYQLNTDRVWYTDNETTPGNYILGYQFILLRFDFFTSLTGSAVGSRNVALHREWAV